MIKPKFVWTPKDSYKSGTDPDHAIEVQGELPSTANVLVGVGARVYNDNVTTLAMWTSPILESGELGQSEKMEFGTDPGQELEAIAMAPEGHVIVSVGMSARHDNISTLVVHCRKLDGFTGDLSETFNTVRAGSNPEGELETEIKETIIEGSKTQELITYIGTRCEGDNITTLRVKTGVLMLNP